MLIDLFSFLFRIDLEYHLGVVLCALWLRPFFLKFSILQTYVDRFVFFSILDWSWVSSRGCSVCTFTFLPSFWLRVGCLPFEVVFTLDWDTGCGFSISETVTVVCPLWLLVDVWVGGGKHFHRLSLTRRIAPHYGGWSPWIHLNPGTLCHPRSAY